MTLPLFDPAAPMPAPAPARADIARRITHRSGLFREVIDGATTGREFAIVELLDGRMMKQFADGKRETFAHMPAFIEEQLRSGAYLEERP